MEDPSSPVSSDDPWADEFARTLGQQRGRVEEFLAGQRERLDRANLELAEQIRRISDESEQDRAETLRAREELQRQSDDLSRQGALHARLKEELEAKQADWDAAQQRAIRHYDTLAAQTRSQQEELSARQEDLQQQRGQIDAARAKLGHDRQAFVLARQEHQAEVEHVAALRQRLEGQTAALTAQREQLAEERADTETQRRRIAQEFRAQRAAHLKELERRRAELDQRDSGQSDQARREREQLQQELDQQRRQVEQQAGDLQAARQRQTELVAELESARQREAESVARLEVARRRQTELRAELETARERPAEASSELESLRQRCDQLQKELAERPQQAESEDADGDFQQRYEMAVDDIRELKARNAELHEQLQRARAAGTQAAASPGVPLSWEEEKRRILAALEADSDEDDPEQAAERLKIEEVIRKTDEVIAEKNREIGELKALLGDQSSNLGSVAVGAAAVGELLDADEIIQEEREKLRGLQTAWEDKLRKAEIDISIERAQIARNRAQLEERLRVFEEKGGQVEADSNTSDKPAGPAKPARGRWLARLGLKDIEDG